VLYVTTEKARIVTPSFSAMAVTLPFIKTAMGYRIYLKDNGFVGNVQYPPRFLW
jgi:hypothetical protein